MRNHLGTFLRSAENWEQYRNSPKKKIDGCFMCLRTESIIKEIGQTNGIRYNRDNIFCHYEITDYKPKEVENYRQQVVEGLEGYKDETDAGEKGKLLLIIQLLQQLIKELTKKLNES